MEFYVFVWVDQGVLVWVEWEGSKLSLSVSLSVTLPLCYVSDLMDFCVFVCVDQGFLVWVVWESDEERKRESVDPTLSLFLSSSLCLFVTCLTWWIYVCTCV